jgi:hypothetical protein
MIKKQEFFDKTVKHLLTQNEKAENKKGECRYHAAKGLMCAMGCHIPDEFYKTDMEGFEIGKVLTDFPEIKKFFPKAPRLREDLQIVHDYSMPIAWEGELKELAKYYRLKWNF